MSVVLFYDLFEEWYILSIFSYVTIVTHVVKKQVDIVFIYV